MPFNNKTSFSPKEIYNHFLLNLEQDGIREYPAWKQIGRLILVITVYAFFSRVNEYISMIVGHLGIWWIQGFLLACCLVVVHDCAHHSFIKSIYFCRWCGGFLGAILLINFSIYRYIHLEHHRYTNTHYPSLF